MTVGSSLRGYKTEPERELDVPDIRVMEPANYRFPAAVDYRNYRLFQNLSRYIGDVMHELHKRARKIVLQVKDHTFSRKYPIMVVNFL